MKKWIKTHDLTLCCLWETHFRSKDTDRVQVKGWKKDVPCKAVPKTACMAILISDKIALYQKKLQETKKDNIH